MSFHSVMMFDDRSSLLDNLDLVQLLEVQNQKVGIVRGEGNRIELSTADYDSPKLWIEKSIFTRWNLWDTIASIDRLISKGMKGIET